MQRSTNRTDRLKDNLTYSKVVVGLLMSVVILLILSIIMEPKLRAKWEKEQLAAVVTSIKQSHKSKKSNLINLDLEAKAAIVYDARLNKILYAKNIDTPMPLASLTKLITALVAAEESSPGTVIKITQQALETEGDSGLLNGDLWREENLLDYMLTVSSNDAATAFAGRAKTRKEFVQKMNKQVANMGLTSLRLYNESGLDLDEHTPGAYGSARDIALLLSYIDITKPELLEATARSEFMTISNTGKLYAARNTNKVAGEIPGLIGGKTGYTDLAGGNLAVIFDVGIGHHIVAVVLGSSKEGRFSDIMKLVSATLEVYN